MVLGLAFLGFIGTVGSSLVIDPGREQARVTLEAYNRIVRLEEEFGNLEDYTVLSLQQLDSASKTCQSNVYQHQQWINEHEVYRESRAEDIATTLGRYDERLKGLDRRISECVEQHKKGHMIIK